MTYLPIWCREGNQVVNEWSIRPEYSHGFKCTEYWCTFKDKKGKINTIMKWVVWD